MLLGLTGAACAGKNAVADILAEAGWAGIDVDRLGHQALAASLPEVVELLGPAAITVDGQPDRRYIGGRVFADVRLLAAYEAIVHPAMFALADAAIAAALAAGRPVCLNAAILYMMPQAGRCDRIVEVRAACLIRLYRARLRDRLPLGRLLARMRRQAVLLRARRRFTDRLSWLDNSGSLAKLRRQVQRIILDKALN
ncbi:MAG: dephospho-CoA kinase [Spirochaetes bacterium GWD1_61_31]|nr:MAG: dephospho-CoA kinase [Spirochaetes bacterium GWB1_60_80]OHD34395.1 MAG: dephospho-CoA kinase [Spirochaetes bacterium GWC1_61_12]OHD35616.1 MAG: dephospho-CoA kinase [Spirochaetes bacterium GWD1_61_31]OHD41654.1 MAG: dephospho-CoA kinase [Spirochaetes bacterium GWE1_60_18]OHD61685.1 MAG: dephospho-CoA kinase [Spirochaetes bacterium GWF1_60_12]HAW86907.1 dephospho-CoA kinase [Spirochaetaceae bacterium]